VIQAQRGANEPWGGEELHRSCQVHNKPYKNIINPIINHRKPLKKHRQGEQPQKTTTYGDNDNKP